MVDQAHENRASNAAPDLNSLAKQINAAHVAVQAAVLAGAQKAIEAGQLLVQAKEQVPFGQWETWVAETTAVSPRTASAYMRVARHWTKIDGANRQRVADLSLRAMLTELAGPAVASIKVAQSEEEPKTLAARVVQFAVEEAGRSGKIKIRETEVPFSPVGSDQTEDPEHAGGPEHDQLAATMKSIREAEERSRVSHRITGDSIQPPPNLDGIKREWNKLDAIGRRDFNTWKKFNGDPDYSDTEIIDVAN